MKKILFAMALTTSGLVLADLIPPPNQNFSKVQYKDKAADELYRGLNVPEQRESSLRTSSSFVKILRTSDGLVEIACRRVNSQDDVKTTCDVKQSLNGKPVPKYVLVRIVG